ncbi:hypothetical protein OUZ56_011134 [Daphnia magna]|uniref:Fucosyltransferase n=1 Tax=Daphnia magna TaxID=35525 RepID=A0ABQ9YZR3_9CRUS|nr:hypothetical protein OUZ56_011134 [Daphnia magna]
MAKCFTTFIGSRIMLRRSFFKPISLSSLIRLFLGTFAVLYVMNFFYNYRLLFQRQQVRYLVTPEKLCPIVLYWTKFYDMKDFGIGVGRATFSQCNHMEGSSGCLTTTDRSFLNDSDAILFHGQDIDVDDLPPPQWRRPHQHFIFVLQESPVYTKFYKFQQPLFQNYFNRTISYRRDSDVPITYGRLQCIDPTPPCSDFPRTDVTTVEDTFNSSAPIKINLASKNRTVAWFVSNCHSNSLRESLVRKLSRFITVDIYGGCGKVQCPTRADCDSMLSRYYRFYLSFENSLCTDYVTEKLYRPLMHDTVPVVYGGSDYSFHLPVGSYVDARDFESAESLANHLKKLMVDDELYLSYFRWRRKYVVNPWAGDWCRLCKMLRDTNTKSKIYSNISAWWTGSVTNPTCIVPPTSFISS